MKVKIIKLARDLSQEICKEKNWKATFYIADEKEYLQRLQAKLQEEVDEYLVDKNIEELADIMEVVYALAQTHGTSIEQLETVRKKKAQERGSFEKHLIIEYEK